MYPGVESMNKCQEISSTADKCDFCGRADNDILKYGPKYKLGKVRAHYYCVLLSNNLKQNGEDNEGMLGFLLKDIKKELKRCSKIKCTYCGKSTANIFCQKKYCKKSFHLPCGLKKGSLHQFKGYYDSYCHDHRVFQFIPRDVLKEAQENKVVCCICYEKVPLWNKMNYIWAPCCQKTWYHKKCLQKLALSAGYFFRCATCNNSDEFVACVLKLGVFIPQQDASWELVPNAFSELLFKYDQCDAEICQCPDGRRADSENSIWEIILCKSCGSQGIHIGCRNPQFRNFDWECYGCQKVTENLNSKKPPKQNENTTNVKNHLKDSTQQEAYAKKRCRATEDLENFILDKRKKSKSEAEEDEEDDDDDDDDDDVDAEIDVITVEKSTMTEVQNTPTKQSKGVSEIKSINIDFEEVLASVKPGPLSFKLKVIENHTHLLEPIKKRKCDIEDFSLETQNSATSSDDEAQFYASVDFDMGIWNEKWNDIIVIVDPDQPECIISEEGEVIKVHDI